MPCLKNLQLSRRYRRSQGPRLFRGLRWMGHRSAAPSIPSPPPSASPPPLFWPQPYEMPPDHAAMEKALAITHFSSYLPFPALTSSIAATAASDSLASPSPREPPAAHSETHPPPPAHPQHPSPAHARLTPQRHPTSPQALHRIAHSDSTTPTPTMPHCSPSSLPHTAPTMHHPTRTEAQTAHGPCNPGHATISACPSSPTLSAAISVSPRDQACFLKLGWSHEARKVVHQFLHVNSPADH